MLPINQIDKSKIEQYRDNFDYNGLANYLSQFYIEDAQRQKEYLNYIRQYRSEGNKFKGIMDRANDEQKQAIQFQMGLQNNRLPKTFINSLGQEQENRFTKDYVNKLNNMGGEDSTTLEFMLEGKTVETRGLFGINWWKGNDIQYKDSGFDLFSKGTGYTEQDLINMGVQVTYKDGQTILSVSKDNPYISNIFMGMQYVNTNRSTDDIRNPIDPNQEGEARYKVRGLDAEGNKVQIGASIDIVPVDALAASRDSNLAKIFFLDSKVATAESIYRTLRQAVGGIGDAFSSTQRDWEEDQFNNPKNIYTYNINTNPYTTLNEAKSIYDDFMNNNSDETQVSYEITGIAVNGAARAQLEQQRQAGLISNADYEKALGNLNDSYRLALNQSLHNYNVFSNIYNDDNDDPALYSLDTEQRVNAAEQLHLDINRKDAIFMHAMMGNKVGTMIVIPGDESQDKNAHDDVEKGKERRYFIEDFMKDAAEEAFRRDTKTRAQMELSDMQTYKYDYDIPDVGKIKNVSGETAILESQNGNEQVISRQEALNYLNKAMIYQDAIDMANQNYWYDNGVSRDYINLKNDVNTWSQLSMAEIYPTAWQRYIEALQRAGVRTPNLDDDTPLDEQGEEDRLYLRSLKNQMAAYILRSVGYNFNNNEQ